jgi:hypothetical protein
MSAAACAALAHASSLAPLLDVLRASQPPALPHPEAKQDTPSALSPSPALDGDWASELALRGRVVWLWQAPGDYADATAAVSVCVPSRPGAPARASTTPLPLICDLWSALVIAGAYVVLLNDPRSVAVAHAHAAELAGTSSAAATLPEPTTIVFVPKSPSSPRDTYAQDPAAVSALVQYYRTRLVVPDPSNPNASPSPAAPPASFAWVARHLVPKAYRRYTGNIPQAIVRPLPLSPADHARLADALRRKDARDARVMMSHLSVVDMLSTGMIL